MYFGLMLHGEGLYGDLLLTRWREKPIIYRVPFAIYCVNSEYSKKLNWYCNTFCFYSRSWRTVWLSWQLFWNMRQWTLHKHHLNINFILRLEAILGQPPHHQEQQKETLSIWCLCWTPRRVKLIFRTWNAREREAKLERIFTHSHCKYPLHAVLLIQSKFHNIHACNSTFLCLKIVLEFPFITFR